METIAQKEMEDELLYEISMFNNTCKEFYFFKNFDKLKKNLLIESLATHTRVLVDFFYCEKKYSDDIIAQDLLPQKVAWEKIRPVLPAILKEAKLKAVPVSVFLRHGIASSLRSKSEI